MKNFFSLSLYAILFCSFCTTTAQNTISPVDKYDNNVGILTEMLEDLKFRIETSVKYLSQEETDFLLDENANRIGALILHLAATEAYYQVYTFENRQFNIEEEHKWATALSLGEDAREAFIDKPIDYYLEEWNKVRATTLSMLKEKDDKWLDAVVPFSSMNNHWAWFHVMEHQANHMGQINFLKKRVPSVDE